MNLAKEIVRLPGLMKTGTEQLRKVPALAETAMLIALNVVASTLFVPITPALHTGFSGIPAVVCGMYYGPICMSFADVIADTLKYIIRPGGSYFPGFAVNKLLTGITYGCFFYKKKITLPRAIIARAYITVFINLILTSLWLNMVYRSPLFTMVRLVKNVVIFPMDVALLYAALKGAEGVRETQPYNIEKLRFE